MIMPTFDFTLKGCLLAVAACAPLLVSAQKASTEKKPAEATCAVKFSVVTEDVLKNINQGLSEKDAKWFEKKIQKKYPDVCYAAPSPDIRLVFYITATPAVYHGTRVVTDSQSNDSPVSGTVTNEDGSTSTVDGTVTTTSTSSTAVPYSVNYAIFTLTVETEQPEEKWKPLRRFQQKGLYNTYLGIPLGGKGHHPVHAVLEEAAKWIHEGGLTNPLETVAPE